MSAKSDRIRDHFVQQTGAIDAITKPFDAQALIAVIENAIRRTQEWRSRNDAQTLKAVEDGEAEAPGSLPPLPPLPPPAVSRVGLSGDIAVIPIGAVLQLLQIEAQSGILVVTDGKTEITVIIGKGLIDLVQAQGAGTEFRLGRYFVELGLVAPEDIDRMIRDQNVASEPAPGRKLIGDLLVASGCVTPEQLRDALARQSSELVYDVLRWPVGRFEFRPEPPSRLAESARLGLPVASVVMEGFRRVDEWRLVEDGLGSFESVLVADPSAVEAVVVERLDKSERRLLEMVDGESTVREIIEQSHMSSFDACKILYQLIEARLVRRRTV
jgi:hypothetical protein